jgi:hypothetical protein
VREDLGVRLAAVAAAIVVLLGTFAASHAAGASPPDDRRYELVSPPNKRGGDVLVTSWRSQASSDGNVFRFAALSGFVDAHGVAVATDYISERSTLAEPGTNGWTTHGIMAPQMGLSYSALIASQEPRYVGRLSEDLSAGIFYAWSPLTDDPSVQEVPNLYRRLDVHTPGIGTYTLVTRCPLCDATGIPLPPFTESGGSLGVFQRPTLAATSPDFEHVLFESRQRLTSDAPSQPPSCDYATFSIIFFCRSHLYEWDHGTVRLAGVLPDGTAADLSIAGQGAGSTNIPLLLRHVISDGADGHSRIFFTQPTDDAGSTLDEGAPPFIATSSGGKLFMRVDHAVTEQLNLSERTVDDTYAPGSFLDASADGTRAFFMTAQALTDDAPADGHQKIYLYDATRPSSDPHNLTLVSGLAGPGSESAFGVIGASDDGRYLYFVTEEGIYVWHDGAESRIGPKPLAGAVFELLGAGANWGLRPNQSRVTPDGRHMLFSAISGEGLGGYDHGNCSTGIGDGCRELYVYSADTGTIRCASCNPSGAPATGMATVDFGLNLVGGTGIDPINNRALAADGSRVFFSSPDPLVAADTNGSYDAYEYDVASGRISLLSSGKSPEDSYFVNASTSGDDAFFLTRERLVGWDTDEAYDLYDARVRGGFTEPAPAPTPCEGEACHGLPQPGVGASVGAGSATFNGAGNLHETLRHAKRGCARGRVLRRVHRKRRCVRTKRSRRAAGHRNAAGATKRRDA